MEYVIPEQKITLYLLTNPKKSGFFQFFGYEIETWTRLRDDLLIIATNSPSRLRRNTPHGQEHEITGAVLAPDGRLITLRTGWMIRTDENGIMSFITAYPA